MKYLLLLFSAFTLMFSTAAAQSQVEILGAGELAGMEMNGKKLQRLIGNVILKHENAIMRCDSAWVDKNTNSFEAFGNVNINEKDSLILNGKYLKYEGNTKKALVQEQVSLTDGQMNLVTDRLDYDLNTRTGYYSNGGHIINQENTLDSKMGSYNANSKTFSFKKNVRLVNPEYVMSCDTLIYNTATKNAFFFGPTTIKGEEGFIYCENGWYNTISRKARFSRNAYVINSEYRLSADSLIYGGKAGIDTALTNITMIDTINHLVIRGNRGIYNRNTNIASVQDKAIASVKMDNDSMHIGAERLRSVGDSSGKKTIYAYYKVKIYKSDMQGTCDSLRYSQKDSVIHMIKNPVLWNKDNQMMSDTIRIRMIDSKPGQAFFIRNAMIIEFIDSGIYNQIRGNDLTCWFTDNKLRRVLVVGNAENIYFQQDDSMTLSSMNYIACSEISILFDSASQLEEITYREQPAGNDYPIDKLPPDENRFLKGFAWLDTKRPKSKDDLLIRYYETKPKK